MAEYRALRVIYTFFVGLLLALFVGAGVNTFYAPPAAPKYPIELNTYNKEPTAEQLAIQRTYDIQNQNYQDKLKPYNRNVSIVTLVIAIVFLAASIASQKRIKFIADGIMLGGLFTLIYSMGRGVASQDSRYLFIAITIGLIIVLVLGYYRFVRGRPLNLQPAAH